MLVFSLQEVKLFDADEIKQIERNIGQQRCKNYGVIVIIYSATGFSGLPEEHFSPELTVFAKLFLPKMSQKLQGSRWGKPVRKNWIAQADVIVVIQDVFTSASFFQSLLHFHRSCTNFKSVSFLSSRLFVGIKKLLVMAEMAVQVNLLLKYNFQALKSLWSKVSSQVAMELEVISLR